MSGTTNSGNVIGSGSDSIVLNMSEDQAEGQDAQFTVNVDGQQIGGVQTVTASHGAGQEEQFTFLGNFAPGQHDVTVSYLNNLILPGDSGDRNLYVDGVTYDGQTVSDTTTGIYSSAVYPPNSTDGPELGNAVFQVNDTTPVPAGTSSAVTPTVAPVSVGSGPDTLVLNMAEDYYNGDAQFNVTVDGQQIGGTLTTTAHSTSGQYQEFDIHGDFGSGSHTVGVTFLNDAIGGFYPGTTNANDTVDRNLYILGGSLDGGPPASGIPAEQATDGTTYFTVTAGNNPSATSTNSGLFGTDGVATSANNPAIPIASGGSSGSGSSTGGSSTGGASASGASDSGSSSSGATGGNPSASSSTTAASTASSTDNTGSSVSSGSNSSGSSSGSGDTSSGSLASMAGNGLSTQDFPAPSSGGSSSASTGSSSGSDTGSSGGCSWGWWDHQHGSGSHTWTSTTQNS